jgi:ABC-2 type transport system ATP-binding protein
MYALEINNLNKKFKHFSLKNINLKLKKGYIMGYVGQNGSGKSTTIKLIMEFLKSDSGTIKVFGKSFLENEEIYKDSIGYVSDECYFPKDFDAIDIIKTWKDFYPSFNENKFRYYLNLWDIPINLKVKGYSQGMKIKLMLASVLTRKSKLLILDEPTSGLDPVVRMDILDILQEYIEDGEKSVLFSTHIMNDLEKIADYICFINKGEIVFQDSSDVLAENFLTIKGSINDLNIVKNNLISYKSTKIGFEGLINKNNLSIPTDKFLIEHANIDEILFYHMLKLKNSYGGNLKWQ